MVIALPGGCGFGPCALSKGGGWDFRGVEHHMLHAPLLHWQHAQAGVIFLLLLFCMNSWPNICLNKEDIESTKCRIVLSGGKKKRKGLKVERENS